MRVLGLAEEDVFFLPYEDQKLHLAPRDEVRRQIVRVVRHVKPTVVTTFDPYGANGHTDHVAMSQFVSDGLSAAADARFYAEGGTPWRVSRLLWQPPHLPWRIPTGTNVAECFGTDFLIDTSSCAALKRAAILEHRSQLPGLEHLFLLDGSGELTLNQEVFRIGWGPRPSQIPAQDLFEHL
jgi:LmbE family N-acetylglucosaminyl deacetylase